MKLYIISQSENSGYDTYSDAVVCAENEEEAKTINPGGFYEFHDNAWYFQYADETEREDTDSTWTHPNNVSVEYIGEAKKELKKGVVCSSFHAG